TPVSTSSLPSALKGVTIATPTVPEACSRLESPALPGPGWLRMLPPPGLRLAPRCRRRFTVRHGQKGYPVRDTPSTPSSPFGDRADMIPVSLRRDDAKSFLERHHLWRQTDVMDLDKYTARLRADLVAAAALGDEKTQATAAALAAAVESSTRLVLLSALSDLAAEVSTALGD